MGKHKKGGDEATELANLTKQMSRAQIDLYISRIKDVPRHRAPGKRLYARYLKVAKVVVSQVYEDVTWRCDCGATVTHQWFTPTKVSCPECEKVFGVDLSEHAGKRVIHGNPIKDYVSYEHKTSSYR
jgi:hypothetical protein